MADTLRLTEQLIAQASVTPNDADCQLIIAQCLASIGFTCEHLPFGPADWRVSNLWAKRVPTNRALHSAGPTLVFAGHTDVVPTGPLAHWQSAPFVPTHRDGRLFGRGASDMKGFSTASTPEQLQQRMHAVLDRHGLTYTLDWTLSAEPFVTTSGSLVQAICKVIESETGHTPELSTTGGTSDARFMARICPQVVELGPPNASIHQIDENIVLTDLETLKNIYRRILETLDAEPLA